MAHSKSAVKRIRQNERNRQRNMAVKSRMKTQIKKALASIEAKDAEAAQKNVLAALSEVDKAASKGVIHKNSAGRKKSMLQRQMAAIS